MDTQRKSVFMALTNLDKSKLWQRPTPGEWSIGEILDHTRVFNASFLPILRVYWFLGRGIAKALRHRPYPVQIDDVYRRPGFPMNLGWIWSPRLTPKKPIPLAEIERLVKEVHNRYRHFYFHKDPDLLGHIYVYDPVIGRLNLIQVLQVGVYHDKLHYEGVLQLAAEFKRHTTPVA